MSKRVRLGMLTPSSNTVLEPVTVAMLADLPEVTAHFSRFRVTHISLDADAAQQFDVAKRVAAAELLGDANCDVIAWNGTSAGVLGFDSDRELCAEITRSIGVPSTSSTLATEELFRRRGIERYALVTPYRADVQDRIVANFADAGFACTGERHLDISDNYSFADVGEDAVAEMCRAVAAEKPQAILIFCTNVRGARVAAQLEDAVDVPIFDSVAITVWKALELAGVSAKRLAKWGRLFSE